MRLGTTRMQPERITRTHASNQTEGNRGTGKADGIAKGLFRALRRYQRQFGTHPLQTLEQIHADMFGVTLQLLAVLVGHVIGQLKKGDRNQRK